jgi:hypothetical protein
VKAAQDFRAPMLTLHCANLVLLRGEPAQQCRNLFLLWDLSLLETSSQLYEFVPIQCPQEAV